MDYIREAINKQYQWARADARNRDLLESLILGYLVAANKRGVKGYWSKRGVLFIYNTTYTLK